MLHPSLPSAPFNHGEISCISPFRPSETNRINIRSSPVSLLEFYYPAERTLARSLSLSIRFPRSAGPAPSHESTRNEITRCSVEASRCSCAASWHRRRPIGCARLSKHQTKLSSAQRQSTGEPPHRLRHGRAYQSGGPDSIPGTVGSLIARRFRNTTHVL